MLIYNLDRSDVPSDKRLVNGSRGVVCELVTLDTCMQELQEIEKWANDATIALPSGVHGSRKITANQNAGITRSSVLKQYCDHLRTKMLGLHTLRFPRVQFANGVRRILSPCCFNQTLYDGGYVFRLQLPIRFIAVISLSSNMRRILTPHRLAWCLTVHKVQGASIDFLHVDLGGCFEFGQAYVALSRARSAGGLSVRNFDECFIKTHEGAKRFHEVRFVFSMKQSTFRTAFGSRICQIYLNHPERP
jgi:hypothetical protein